MDKITVEFDIKVYATINAFEFPFYIEGKLVQQGMIHPGYYHIALHGTMEDYNAFTAWAAQQADLKIIGIFTENPELI